MADSKLSDLTELATTPAASDELYINDGGVSSKITYANLTTDAGAFTADSDTQITAKTAIVLDQATGNEIALDLQYTVNKASSGDDTGLVINQTDTASPGTSFLIDAQVGGTRVLGINNAGEIVAADPDQKIKPETGKWLFTDNSGTEIGIVEGIGFGVSTNGAFNFTNSTNPDGTVDVRFIRRATTGALVVNSALTSGGTDDAGLEITQTLNDTGAAGGSDYYAALKVNITETDTTGWDTVNLLDLQVGGSSKVRIGNDGFIQFDGDTSLGVEPITNGLRLWAPQKHIFLTTDDIASGDVFTFAGSVAAVEMTASSGSQAFFNLTPSVNQSSTAGYTGILLDVLETATGSGSNNLLDLQVGSTGKYTVDNTGAVTAMAAKETIWVPAAAMRPTVSNGCAVLTDVETTAGRPDMQVLDFDATADEHAQFQVAFPKKWDKSTVTYQVFWTSTGSDTDGVTWALQGVATANSDTIDVAYGTAITVDDSIDSAAEDCLITAESSAVTIAGTPGDDELCFFRLFRDVSDANDTATEDARLLGIKMFFNVTAGTDT